MATLETGERHQGLLDELLAEVATYATAVDRDLVLQSVSLRTASIGPTAGAPAVVLELPVLPPAATGSLPPAASLAAPPAGAMPPVPAAPMPVAPVAPPTANAMPAPPPGDSSAMSGRLTRRARGTGQPNGEGAQNQMPSSAPSTDPHAPLQRQAQPQPGQPQPMQNNTTQ